MQNPVDESIKFQFLSKKQNRKTIKKTFSSALFFTSFILLFYSFNGVWSQTSQKVLRDKNPGGDEPTVKATILGVFHFSDPGQDSYKPKFPFNILEENRQRELNDLLEKLKAYSPTKIILECNREKYDSLLNVRYKQFLTGDFDIVDKHNEIYQIGFKLAKMLGHKKVYCSDADAKWFGAEIDWENFDHKGYLKSLGQYEKMRRHDYFGGYEKMDSLKTVQTLEEHLALTNEVSNLLKYHQIYLTNNVLEGAGDNYIGADGVARWYRRNIRIFSNIYDISDLNEDERLLIIYGVGHAWTLRQFFQDSPDYEYVELNSILKGAE